MFSICILAFCLFAVLVESGYLNRKTLSTLFPHKSYSFSEFSKLHDAGTFKEDEIEILSNNMIEIKELVKGMQWLETKSIQDQKSFEILTEGIKIGHAELEEILGSTSEDEHIRLDLASLRDLAWNVKKEDIVIMELTLYHHTIICQEYYERCDAVSTEENINSINLSKHTLFTIFDILHLRFQKENCIGISTQTSFVVDDYQNLFPLADSAIQLVSFRLTHQLHIDPKNCVPYFFPRLMKSQIEIVPLKNLSKSLECSSARGSSLTAFFSNREKSKELKNIIGDTQAQPDPKFSHVPHFQLLKNFSLSGSLVPCPMIPRETKVTEEIVLKHHLTHLLLLICQMKADMRRCLEHVFETTVHDSLLLKMSAIRKNMKEIQALLRVDEKGIIPKLNEEIASFLESLTYQSIWSHVRQLSAIIISVSEYLPSLALENFYPKNVSIPVKDSVFFRTCFSHKVFELLREFFSTPTLFIDHNFIAWVAKIAPIHGEFKSLLVAHKVDINSQKIAITGLRFLAYFLFVHNRLFNNISSLNERSSLMVSLLPQLQVDQGAVNSIIFLSAGECTADDPQNLEKSHKESSANLYNAIASIKSKLIKKVDKKKLLLNEIRRDLGGKKVDK